MNTPLPLQLDDNSRQQLQQSLKAFELSRRTGQGWAMAESQLSLARFYRERGHLDFSLSLLEAALAASPGLDQRVELHCETVNVLVDHARALDENKAGSGLTARNAARQHIFKASMLAAHLADSVWEATVLMHLSRVLDRLGDKSAATHLHHRAQQLRGRQTGPDHLLPAFNPYLLPGLGRLADV